MPLNNFFQINLPYGMEKNTNDEWFAFNRKHVPIGYNNNNIDLATITNLPIFTKYRNLTNNNLLAIAGSEEFVRRDTNGDIVKIYFYNDGNNPNINPSYFADYFDKLQTLSGYIRF